MNQLKLQIFYISDRGTQGFKLMEVTKTGLTGHFKGSQLIYGYNPYAKSRFRISSKLFLTSDGKLN